MAPVGLSRSIRSWTSIAAYLRMACGNSSTTPGGGSNAEKRNVIRLELSYQGERHIRHLNFAKKDATLILWSYHGDSARQEFVEYARNAGELLPDGGPATPAATFTLARKDSANSLDIVFTDLVSGTVVIKGTKSMSGAPVHYYWDATGKRLWVATPTDFHWFLEGGSSDGFPLRVAALNMHAPVGFQSFVAKRFHIQQDL
jgi:hypothetical protein